MSPAGSHRARLLCCPYVWFQSRLIAPTGARRGIAVLAVLATGAPLAACAERDEPNASEQARLSGPPRTGSARNPELDGPLIEAAARGRTERVRGLIARGASVRARDARGRTALTAAAFSNRVGAARALVAAGADVNIEDDTDQSPYLVASSEVRDDPRLLELFLDHGARVNDKDSYNGTALIRAAERGHPRIVRRLLAAGIDRDHVNRLGWTALLEAVVLGDGGPAHEEVVRLLVEAGADTLIADREGVTALEHARRRGYDGIARILERV